MEASGATTPTELARAIGMTGYSAPQRAKRWIDGSNEPDFEGTVLLLAAAGMLNIENPTLVVEGSSDAAVLREIRALDRRLDVDVLPRLDRLADERRDRARSTT